MTDDETSEALTAIEPTEQEMAQSSGKGKRKLDDRYALVTAVRSLLDGRPTDPDLQTMLAENGWLPITKFTVEKEAKVDRRRFSGNLSDHPDISDLLKRLKPTRGVARTTTELLRSQAEKIDVLEQRLTAARSWAAAQVIRIDALNEELRRAAARIKRLKSGETEE